MNARAETSRSRNSPWQFSVGALFVLTTFVALATFVFTLEPCSGALLVLFSVPAGIRTIFCLRRHEDLSLRPATWQDAAGYFVISFLLTFAICCLGFCLLLTGLGAGHLVGSMLLGALALCLVTYLLALTWPRKVVSPRMDNWPTALDDARSYLHVNPRYARAYVDVAVLLATSPLEKFKNGREARELATTACELSQWESWRALDALSQACAATQDFAEAAQYAELALVRSPFWMHGTIRGRMAEYEQRRNKVALEVDAGSSEGALNLGL